MSFTIHGIGVSGGIAIGHAQLVSHAQLEVAHYDISKSRVAEEKARFDAAVVTARAELASLGEHIPAGTPAEFEAFLNVHLMILDDPTLSEMPKQLIESLQCNAEWALKLQMDALIDQFERIEDGYLRDRKTDVIQVVERILKVLMGRPGQVLARSAPEENSILVAHDLSPAECHPVQESSVRKLHHRPRGRHFAYGDHRPQPEHPVGGGIASRAHAHPRERSPDHRRQQRRGHRQSGPDGACRIQTAPGTVGTRAPQAQATQKNQDDHARWYVRRTASQYRAA